MKTKDIHAKLNSVLLKMAQGFSYREVTEEYVPSKSSGQIGMQELSSESKVDNAGLTLAKRKIATHYVPPDMLAIKLLLQQDEHGEDTLSCLSDEELVALKNKLIKQLTEEDE